MSKRLKALAAAAAGMATLSSVAAAGEVWLTIDRPENHRFDRPVGQVVIANPAVADVQVMSATEMMLMGRSHGATTITFLDREGQRMDEMQVRVGNARGGTVLLQSGGQRYTFSCTDRCQQTAVLGDAGLKAMQQIVAEAAARQGAGAQGAESAGFGTQSVPVAASPAPSQDTAPAGPQTLLGPES